MTSLKDQLEENGFVIIENFLSKAEVEKLKSAGINLSYEASKEKFKARFPDDVNSFQYFFDSADKIGYFFENDSLNEDGSLKVHPEIALNKVGHALHRLHPDFRDVTLSEKVKNVCRSLNLQRPAIVQSMYIYKNARIGSEVVAHKDSSYLYTEPQTLYGFWIALDNATTENGCLWFFPGSQKDKTYDFRGRRNPDKNSEIIFINTGLRPQYIEGKFIATPVNKGSCVLIHGDVLHLSNSNHSDKSRHAYTFHVYDSGVSEYSADNWLQAEFELLYGN